MAPKLSAELARFIEAGVAIQVGTRDTCLFPEAVRGIGARVEHGRSEVTAFVPEATGARTFANVLENGRVALCFSRIEDHRTIQLKGRCVELRPALESERELVDRYRRAFAEALAAVGLPLRLTFRIAHWPCRALRMTVESSFVQTPGPGAGEPLTLDPSARKR